MIPYHFHRAGTSKCELAAGRAKNWRSHGRQWRVKTDQGHQELTVKRPMCDYATEFRKVAKYKKCELQS